MNWLAENALPIWICGAIALTMATIIYFQTRTNGALLGVAGVVVVTALLLLVEHLWETPREAVERTIYELADAVERNDVPRTLAYLSPNAALELRSDVETLMPLVTIERANIVGTPEITLTGGDDPSSAAVRVRGIIVATIKKNGMKGGQNDELTLNLVRSGDRWFLESYSSQRNWNRALGR